MHYYEKNVVEIKQEYTNFLTNIMTPLIYEGIKNIYDRSLITEKKFKENQEVNSEIKNPGVFKIFQIYLKDIQTLNDHMIQTEYERIKERSKCSEWFDDLVKAVVKSNIILLTYNATDKKCKIVEKRYHENIKIENFIHKCYIECARTFFNYPEIFYHEYSTIDIKRNQREAYNLIKEAIREAIRKMLPIKLILEEYLKNDYIDDNNDISNAIPESRYSNIKSLIKKDLSDDQEYNKKTTGGYTNYEIFEDTDINDKLKNLDRELFEHTETNNDEQDEYINDIENNPNIVNDNYSNNTNNTNNTKTNNINNDEYLLDMNKNDINEYTENIEKNTKSYNYDINKYLTETNYDNLSDLILGKDTNYTENNDINYPKKTLSKDEGMKVLEGIKNSRNSILDIMNDYKMKLNNENDIVNSEIDIKINNKLDTEIDRS